MLPFWAIVSFGAYLLASLGWGVLTFKDTEGAYKELVQVRSDAEMEEWMATMEKDGLIKWQ